MRGQRRLGATGFPGDSAAYLAYGVAKGAKASTLGRRVAAIRCAHKLASLSSPTDAEAVKATLRGIRRTIGAAKVKKAPALAERVKAMVGLPEYLVGPTRSRSSLVGICGRIPTLRADPP